MRALRPLLAALVLVACDDGTPEVDAGPPEADAGPAVPASIEHCAYEDVPPTARSGGTVTSGALSAGTAEAFLDVPLGASVGSYTARADGFGGGGFLEDEYARRTELAGTFAPSIGLETIPRIRALALSAGGETVILMKADISLSYQGFVHDVEAALGDEYAGKVIIAASHTHSSFGNYTGHTALFLGFGEMRPTVYNAFVSQMTAVAQAAIADLQPAQIGFTRMTGFDPTNRVNRDRRGENNDLDYGPNNERIILAEPRSMDDDQLFVIRVDTAAGDPLAVVPVFGMHGTIHSERNTLISTDSSGGVERVLEESFDSDVLVMHLQGAGGDVSPAGLGAIDCSGRKVCADFGRPESIGHYALTEIRDAYDAAGASMQTDVPVEMLTRTVPLGPDWRTFSIRDGALEYAPFVASRAGDGVVYGADDQLVSPIDEFAAPFGAALCGSGDDLVIRLPRTILRGADQLGDYSYWGCNRVEAIDNVLSTLVDIDFEEAPFCETTRTVVSALRIGDWMIGTLPGEPVTLLRNHLQELSPMGPERTIVVGYAQDHGGYLLRPEDWLSGGYEPSISFWGPLEGEYVAEQTAALMALAVTDEREDATADGVPRPTTPVRPENLTIDDAMNAGTVPATLPSVLVTHDLQMPASAQPASQVERMQSVFFTFIGEDPLRGGTPRVFVEREVTPGTWETVVRRSGRPVQDGDLLLTWSPDPPPPTASTSRTHYYTVEMQVASPLGMPGLDAIADRWGMPEGNYRFRVVHSMYEVTSDPFEVVPATFEASVTTSGTAATVTLGAQNDHGFRLLSLQDGTRSNGLVPLQGSELTVTIDPGAGMVRTETLTTDDAGQVTVMDAVGATVTLTDRFNNSVVVTP